MADIFDDEYTGKDYLAEYGWWMVDGRRKIPEWDYAESPHDEWPCSWAPYKTYNWRLNWLDIHHLRRDKYLALGCERTCPRV